MIRMLKKVTSSLVAFSILMGATAPAMAYNAEAGNYFFRYRSPVAAPAVNPGTPIQAKDITAYYVAGVNKEFSEKLPMKPDWQDDRWVITKGSLPDGITFDASTLTFVGRATSEGRNIAVELAGFDENNVEVATAVAYFSVFELPDTVIDLDLYAHTGKYKFDEIPLPAGFTINGDPKLLTAPPPGIAYNARYFEGTPTKAGPYGILAMGYDFLGKPIVAFTGTYLVEDGPTFNRVPDDLKHLARRDGYLGAVWDRQPIQGANRAINGDPSKIRYYIVAENGAPLPGSLAYTSNPYDRRLSGVVSDWYDQVTVRYKAIDTDGTEGLSNTFRLGSLNGEGICQPYGYPGYIQLDGVANVVYDGYRIPSGYDTSLRQYELISGALPEGMKLDAATGQIHGTPAHEETQSDILVGVTFPGNASATPVQCGPYRFVVSPQPFSLAKSDYARQNRVGSTLSVKLTPTGAGLIAPYAMTMDQGSILPAGVTFDPQTGIMSGALDVAGRYSAVIRLKNGNAAERTQMISFSVHNPLKINNISPNPRIAQYEVTNALAVATWDEDAVIGDAVIELVGPTLPDDIEFDGQSVISGGTRLPPVDGGYSPYQFKITDATGESDTTDPFSIIITPRNPLERGATVDLSYSVNLNDPGKRPFSVTQAPLAKGYIPLRYALTGPGLPAGLHFDETSGRIHGMPERRSEASGYRYTISEDIANGLSETSDEFSIIVSDPPAIPDISTNPIITNVDIPGLRSDNPETKIRDIRDFLVGFETSVRFVNYEPQIAGLSLDTSNGVISGTPSQEFSGAVEINYVDGADRQGKVIVPITIHPAPKIGSKEASYTVPRLSNASGYDIVVAPTNSGFYAGSDWTVTGLPTDMSYTQTGNSIRIIGRTKDPVGSQATVNLTATSRANGLPATHSLTIVIGEPIPFEISTPADTKIAIRMSEDLSAVRSRDTISPSAWLSGSFLGPVTWSISGNPEWMSIDPVTGDIVGKPTTLGDWQISVSATDADSPASTATEAGSETISVRVTLDGSIVLDGRPESFAVRAGETFQSVGRRPVSNVVNPYVVTTPDLPSEITHDEERLSFRGFFENAGSYPWTLSVTDAHDRTLAAGQGSYKAEVIAPLSIKAPTADGTARAFLEQNPVDLRFSPAVNPMGTVSYELIGDLPGTLYYKSSVTGSAEYRRTPLGPLVDRQGSGEAPAQAEERLADDRLIFDQDALTLRGVASAIGTFPIAMNAVDDHAATGYAANPSDAKRVENNTASAAYALVVEDRVPLELGPPTSAVGGQQYAPNDELEVAFAAATNALGTVKYEIAGDLPGTLYYISFQDGRAEYSRVPEGPIIERQNSGESRAQAEARLAPDHMIFDAETLILKGIPSSDGIHTFHIKAVDDHAIAGLKDSDGNMETADVTVNVAPAANFEVANVLGTDTSATAETLHQYTSTAGIHSTTKGAAYGLPVTWTTVSGSTPAGVSRSPATGDRGRVLSYGGYPTATGTFTNLSSRAVDAAGREAVSNPVTLTVGPRLELEMASSKVNPRRLIVFKTDADMTIAGRNTAFGQPISQDKWVVTGANNLPPNVTYTINNGNVKFQGVSDVIGIYTGITVTGTDARGASASIDLVFQVVADPEPIDLQVANIRTKPGFPVRMEPPFAETLLETDNTYGAISFYSYDLPAIDGISLNGSTGHIEGSFSTAQQVEFDLYVTDETARITSKPITVDVIPNLRLIVPGQLAFEQGSAPDQTIATDYVIGKVTYAKGAGSWPNGIDVDPDTGSIIGIVDDVADTYEGLTIIGTDTFGAFADIRSSNAFRIVVTPIDADPIISDIQDNRLMYGIEGQPAASFTPTVKDSKYGRKWVNDHTIYELSHDLSAYGLKFDEETGLISGTATAPVIIRDLVVTVTSKNGVADSTVPFWFGIQPQKALTATAGQVKTYYQRLNKTTVTNPLQFDNYVGNLVFSKQPGVTSQFDEMTGQYTQPPVSNPASAINGMPAAGWENTTTATDEFGRKGTYQFNAYNMYALTISAADMTVSLNADITEQNLPVIGGKYGTLSYSSTGLPSGLNLDPVTGGVSGKVTDSSLQGKVVAVTVSVTDTFTAPGAANTSTETKSVTYKITVEAAKALWRFYGDKANQDPRWPGDYIVISELRLLQNGADVTNRHTNPTADSSTSQNPPSQAFDGNISAANGWSSGPSALSHWLQWEMPATVNITSMLLTSPSRAQVPASNAPLQWRIMKSVDGGATWQLVWADAKNDWGSLQTFETKPRDLTMTLGKTERLVINEKTYSNEMVPTITGGSGGSVTATGLPAGMSVNSSTGALSGKIPAGTPTGTAWPVRVTVTDLLGRQAHVDYTIKVASEGARHRYWRVTWQPGTDGWTDILEAQFYSADGDNESLRVGKGTATVIGNNTPGGGPWMDPKNAVDGTTTTWFSPYAYSDSKLVILKIDFASQPIYVARFKSVITDPNGGNNYSKWSGKASRVQWSDDNVNWTDHMVSPKLGYNGGDDMTAQ